MNIFMDQKQARNANQKQGLGHRMMNLSSLSQWCLQTQCLLAQSTTQQPHSEGDAQEKLLNGASVDMHKSIHNCTTIDSKKKKRERERERTQKSTNELKDKYTVVYANNVILLTTTKEKQLLQVILMNLRNMILNKEQVTKDYSQGDNIFMMFKYKQN